MTGVALPAAGRRRELSRWADVDASAIRHNLEVIRRVVGERVAVMAMVKAAGYGHGAALTAAAALEGGATWLGVSSAEEALQLRAEGFSALGTRTHEAIVFVDIARHLQKLQLGVHFSFPTRTERGVRSLLSPDWRLDVGFRSKLQTPTGTTAGGNLCPTESTVSMAIWTALKPGAKAPPNLSRRTKT